MATKERLILARSALVEFVVIVTGVLVALGVDEWREARRDRILELQYAERLRADLVRDTARFAEYIDIALSSKSATLRWLAEPESYPLEFDSAEDLMEALRFSTFVALPELQDAVFREMESTGRLALLTDPSLRTELANYYAEYEFLEGIFAQSFGRFREVATGALPGAVQYSSRVDSLSTPMEAVAEGVRAIRRHPDFASAVNTELAYASELVAFAREGLDRSVALLERLNVQYPEQ